MLKMAGPHKVRPGRPLGHLKRPRFRRPKGRPMPISSCNWRLLRRVEGVLHKCCAPVWQKHCVRKWKSIRPLL